MSFENMLRLQSQCKNVPSIINTLNKCMHVFINNESQKVVGHANIINVLD